MQTQGKRKLLIEINLTQQVPRRRTGGGGGRGRRSDPGRRGQPRRTATAGRVERHRVLRGGDGRIQIGAGGPPPGGLAGCRARGRNELNPRGRESGAPISITPTTARGVGRRARRRRTVDRSRPRRAAGLGERRTANGEPPPSSSPLYRQHEERRNRRGGRGSGGGAACIVSYTPSSVYAHRIAGYQR